MAHDRPVRRARTNPDPSRFAGWPPRAWPHGLVSGPGRGAIAAPGPQRREPARDRRGTNPEFASMQFEAAAARERPESAGALPDPTFRVELMDVTNAGMEASPSLNPSKIGATKYTVMQMLPWFGKRDAMRGVAEADAQVGVDQSRCHLARAFDAHQDGLRAVLPSPPRTRSSRARFSS